jgi:RNA polymerase sigma-70 factor (ECF subfamily)
MDETEMIEQLRLGNENVFRQFVDNYRKKVITTCLGFVHNIHDAEDIAQEVFIEVYRSIGQFRGNSKISTWVYRIAVTRSLNFIRDNKKRKWFQSFEEVVEKNNRQILTLPSGKSDNPEFIFENTQRAALLHTAIDWLPKNQKIAFTLSKYDDLSYEEISNVMDLSVSSVESLIHRAKTNLQKKLYECYKKKCI